MESHVKEVVFEESLSDEWSRDLGMVEVPLDEKPLWYLGIVVFVLGFVVVSRILGLNIGSHEFYTARAEVNIYQFEHLPAPRGVIRDRFGKVLADNRPVFSAVLNLREFLRESALQEKTLQNINEILHIAPDAVWQLVKERTADQSGDPIVLNTDLTQAQLVALEALNMETLRTVASFKRIYPEGPVMASLLGYLGFPNVDDLKKGIARSGQDMIGKSGIELFYDEALRGTPGLSAKLRDAKGHILGDEKKEDPKVGATLDITIDTEFQKYFYDRFEQALRSLGRTSGAALAFDPRNGEVLAFLNFPSFDNNIFSASGKNEEKRALLTSPSRPLFNRLTSGLYNPGSTIKPLHGLASITEGVMDPKHAVFSPGYLDVPNPYNADEPTRFVDWRYQGNIDLYDAIAQSSNVYFYLAGGGSPQRDPQLGPEWDNDFGVKGLGITKLLEWWKKFRLDLPTGIDVPHEAKGFLPTPEWKKGKTGRSWLLGDTYNVSIGQGDLSITPVALLNYITTIANGGTMYEPTIHKDGNDGKQIADLKELKPYITEIQKAMRRTVTSNLGTARILNTLPFPVAGKTGSAQVLNNTQENAFFVGYGPAYPGETDDPAKQPQIAILVLVENSKEGSLNAVPIANDVLYWYYVNRIQK